MERSSFRNLPTKYFARPADVVARDLLGKKIVRILPDGEKLEGIITETEAYMGIEDKASHSFGGRRTKRNEVMYGPPGRVYVYFTYGMHWMMNFITGEKENPQGVLIRGVKGVSGPGRVTKYLQIGKDFYGGDIQSGEDLGKSKRIWVKDTGFKYKENEIKKLPRVGIQYAGEWKNKKLRFLVESTKPLRKSPKAK